MLGLWQIIVSNHESSCSAPHPTQPAAHMIPGTSKPNQLCSPFLPKRKPRSRKEKWWFAPMRPLMMKIQTRSITPKSFLSPLYSSLSHGYTLCSPFLKKLCFLIVKAIYFNCRTLVEISKSHWCVVFQPFYTYKRNFNINIVHVKFNIAWVLPHSILFLHCRVQWLHHCTTDLE